MKDAENKPTPHSKTIYAGIKSGNHRAPKKMQAGRKGAGGEKRRESKLQIPEIQEGKVIKH